MIMDIIKIRLGSYLNTLTLKQTASIKSPYNKISIKYLINNYLQIIKDINEVTLCTRFK